MEAIGARRGLEIVRHYVGEALEILIGLLQFLRPGPQVSSIRFWALRSATKQIHSRGSLDNAVAPMDRNARAIRPYAIHFERRPGAAAAEFLDTVQVALMVFRSVGFSPVEAPAPQVIPRHAKDAKVLVIGVFDPIDSGKAMPTMLESTRRRRPASRSASFRSADCNRSMERTVASSNSGTTGSAR